MVTLQIFLVIVLGIIYILCCGIVGYALAGKPKAVIAFLFIIVYNLVLSLIR